MNETRLRFEVVVVGAGPAGLAAACAAAESGRRTALVDDTPWLGGQIWRGQQAHPTIPQAARWVERFRRTKASLLDQCTILGPAGVRILLAEHPTGPREIQWERLILATGARELFCLLYTSSVAGHVDEWQREGDAQNPGRQQDVYKRQPGLGTGLGKARVVNFAFGRVRRQGAPASSKEPGQLFRWP